MAEGELKLGDLVNLERALAAHIRFGGHFVQASIYRLELYLLPSAVLRRYLAFPRLTGPR